MDELSTVRVMTWNIHGAVGRNPQFDLARVIQLIQRTRPDIVALQEIDSRRRPAKGDPFAILREVLGTHGVEARSITTADGDYGQMLISRWRMTAIEVHDISYPEREPRRAIKSEIDTPAGPLRVVATHLGLSIRERHSQVKALLEIAGDTSIATIIVGDFNDWFWVGSVRKALSRELPGRTRYRTFPSMCPLLRLDRIYCRPADVLVASSTDALACRLSDHIPVVADVRPAVRG
jgi:endonuclease/exonuclease/phosphatase family metal-dependent hydrolase